MSFAWVVITGVAACVAGAPSSGAEEDGTLHIQPFVLPESSFLSAESRAALKAAREHYRRLRELSATCPPIEGVDRERIAVARQCLAEVFYKTPLYRRLREAYTASIETTKIGGVGVEVFTPSDGIAPTHARRVLINLHGGSFSEGARTLSHLESLPIASLGRIRVIGVDYRLGPEFIFPAASEDVAAVYRELLKTYPPQNIGIYGCSAGAQLTAGVVAWLLKEKLPLPGAVGMFCGAAGGSGGDSRRFADAMAAARAAARAETERKATERKTVAKRSYFEGADMDDPLVAPLRSEAVLGRFPAALLITSSRDFLMSSVVHTHARLTALGVDAELHVWEGHYHAFLQYPDLPESREAYRVIVSFFDRHLGG